MSLHITNDEGRCQVAIVGGLTLYQVADYKHQLLSECEWASQLVLDMSRVEELDTSGVQLLLAWQKQLRSAGGELSVSAIAEPAAQVLDVFNLGDNFKPTPGGN
ncbi:MAG: STAS domain-containing protein [Gammaproteobacteria bacterium]|nr:STAS domain-containing protein [Gammaproteobacteria bacterium]